jgi:hypothetical protein
MSGASRPRLVCGWIDFDIDGRFASHERACTHVDPGQRSGELTWTVPPKVVVGNTFARVRIGYDTDRVARPFGSAGAGEVEDYSLEIGNGPRAIDDEVVGWAGERVVVSILDNDVAGGFPLDADSVRLLASGEVGAPEQSVVVPGQGVWETTGLGQVAFTPELDFFGIAQVAYVVDDTAGNRSNVAFVRAFNVPVEP